MEENLESLLLSMCGKLFIVLIIAITLCLPGCAQKTSSPELDSYYVVIENVPFIKQKDNYCGPASMASVLQFYGQDVNQDEIAEVIYIPELNGALISDMENYARNNGYNVVSKNGSIEEIKSSIDNGTPVILLVDLGKWKVSAPHYYVAHGYNEKTKTLLLHTGYKQNQEISYSKLEDQWERMNRLMLAITP